MVTIKIKILNSIKPIVKNSKFVQIDRKALVDFAEKIAKKHLPEWNYTLQFKGNLEDTIQYYFFLDSINFCFWAEKGKEKWKYKKEHKLLDGYYAFSYAIRKAIERNSRLLDANYLSKISFKEFSEIFNGKGELKLLKERHKIIRDNFKILSKKYNGQALNIFKRAEFDANKIVDILLKDFPSFRDNVDFNGKKIYFLKRAQLFSRKIYFFKRAQIFVSDLSYACPNLKLKNLSDLTIFADYKLPQLLQEYKVLKYNKKLSDKIKDEKLIKNGSQEEIEIRANTVYSCEMLLQELNKMGKKMNSQDLDWMLWEFAEKKKFKTPYHKTISTFY